jgi:hypothetical protein
MTGATRMSSCFKCGGYSVPGGTSLTSESRRSNPPERAWVRLIRVRIFDHVESTAVRPQTVLIIDIPSRAPPGRIHVRLERHAVRLPTGTGRPCVASLYESGDGRLGGSGDRAARTGLRGQGYGDGPWALQPVIWPHRFRPTSRCRKAIAGETFLPSWTVVSASSDSGARFILCRHGVGAAVWHYRRDGH